MRLTPAPLHAGAGPHVAGSWASLTHGSCVGADADDAGVGRGRRRAQRLRAARPASSSRAGLVVAAAGAGVFVVLSKKSTTTPANRADGSAGSAGSANVVTTDKAAMATPVAQPS